MRVESQSAAATARSNAFHVDLLVFATIARKADTDEADAHHERTDKAGSKYKQELIHTFYRKRQCAANFVVNDGAL